MSPLLLLLLMKVSLIIHVLQVLPGAGWLAVDLASLNYIYIYIYVYIVHIDSVFNFTPPAGPLQWGLPLKCGTHALCACSMIICGSLATTFVMSMKLTISFSF
jgi:hypothetical protein